MTTTGNSEDGNCEVRVFVLGTIAGWKIALRSKMLKVRAYLDSEDRKSGESELGRANVEGVASLITSL